VEVFGIFQFFPHRYGDSHPSIHHSSLTVDRIYVLALRIRMQIDLFLNDMVVGCVFYLCERYWLDFQILQIGICFKCSFMLKVFSHACVEMDDWLLLL
jgi:hypothetical protein